MELKIKELEKEIQEKELEIENITKLLIKACEENDLNFMAEGPKQSKQLKENLEVLYNELMENTEIFEEKEKYFEKKFNNINNIN